MSRRRAPWRSLSEALSDHICTRSGTQRRWEWCVCHLQDTEGETGTGAAALGWVTVLMLHMHGPVLNMEILETVFFFFFLMNRSEITEPLC